MEQRLIDANKIKYRTIGAGGWNQPENVVSDYEIEKMPAVDAVPVDEIIFHHILIDKNGIPEVKLQFGERTMTLRRENDPVDAVPTVHSEWFLNGDGSGSCMNCGKRMKIFYDEEGRMKFCPNCGAKMDGGSDEKL